MAINTVEYDDASWRCWLVLVNLFTRAEIKKHIFSNRSLIKIHNSAADEEEEIMRWYIFMTQLRPRRVPVVHELAFAGTALSAAAGSLFHKKKKEKVEKGHGLFTMEETDRQITPCCRLIRGASQREGEKKGKTDWEWFTRPNDVQEEFRCMLDFEIAQRALFRMFHWL